MGWQPTTRLHVSGYRFLLRRIECALLGRDIRGVNEPIRASMQSLMVGAVLAIIMLAGCALLAMIRPQPALANAPIVMGKQSGALYVRIGETLHPVLNLASARLIMRTNADPQPVPESELSHNKRGLLLGIPGAPQFLGIPLGEDELRWTVCDSGGAAPSTTVVIGPAEGPLSHPLAGEQSVLVRPVSGGSTYLLYAGRRAVVNLNEPAVVRALGLDGQVPLAVSPTLLNAVPEAPPITTPRIPNPSTRGPAALPGFPVGSVLRVARADGDEYFVVLSHGIQRIGRVAADLLRFTDSHGARTAISVAPDLIRATPTVTELPVATFPDRSPTAVECPLYDAVRRLAACGVGRQRFFRDRVFGRRSTYPGGPGAGEVIAGRWEGPSGRRRLPFAGPQCLCACHRSVRGQPASRHPIPDHRHRRAIRHPRRRCGARSRSAQYGNPGAVAGISEPSCRAGIESGERLGRVVVGPSVRR